MILNFCSLKFVLFTANTQTEIQAYCLFSKYKCIMFAEFAYFVVKEVDVHSDEIEYLLIFHEGPQEQIIRFLLVAMILSPRL